MLAKSSVLVPSVYHLVVVHHCVGNIWIALVLSIHAVATCGGQGAMYVSVPSTLMTPFELLLLTVRVDDKCLSPCCSPA